MKLELESTPVLALLNGKAVRIWKGHTGRGVAVTVYVAAVQVRADADNAELEHELQEIGPPSGVCRVCGCSDHLACKTPNGPCFWVDAGHTLCSGCAG